MPKQTRERLSRCDKCSLLQWTTCPLMAIAWQRHRWEGLEACEMAEAIDRMTEAQRGKVA